MNTIATSYANVSNSSIITGLLVGLGVLIGIGAMRSFLVGCIGGGVAGQGVRS